MEKNSKKKKKKGREEIGHKIAKHGYNGRISSGGYRQNDRQREKSRRVVGVKGSGGGSLTMKGRMIGTRTETARVILPGGGFKPLYIWIYIWGGIRSAMPPIGLP